MDSDQCSTKGLVLYLSIVFAAICIMLFALVAVDSYVDFRDNNAMIMSDYMVR